MKFVPFIISIAIGTAASAAVADVRELSQAELRQQVSRNNAIQTNRLIAGVENHTGGDVVEIRAFSVSGTITYRILVRHDDGRLGAIMVDGATGFAVKNSSEIGTQVMAAASANPPRQSGVGVNNGNRGASGASRNNNDRARGNRGGGNRGNGNGNGGGNGNGNGGGNGGGNGKGNGRN